jgi:hypothetical protein
VDVDVFFSREDWRPWKTIALGDNVIKLRASGEFSRRAHVAEASGVQPGELLYAYEDAGRDRVEIVVGWQTGFHSRADLQVEAFDKNGREIEWTNTSTFQHCRTFAFDDTKETIAGYRYRIRYYTDKVSFFNASLIPNQRTQVMHRVVRLNVPQQELTPAKIADNVEAAMKRFASAEYEAETTATVNTNAFRTDVEPVLVKATRSIIIAVMHRAGSSTRKPSHTCRANLKCVLKTEWGASMVRCTIPWTVLGRTTSARKTAVTHAFRRQPFSGVPDGHSIGCRVPCAATKPVLNPSGRSTAAELFES